MDTTIQDTLAFFDRHQAVYLLYACFQEKLLARFPESRYGSRNLGDKTG